MWSLRSNTDITMSGFSSDTFADDSRMPSTTSFCNHRGVLVQAAAEEPRVLSHCPDQHLFEVGDVCVLVD
jgi:hypothetical protein